MCPSHKHFKTEKNEHNKATTAKWVVAMPTKVTKHAGQGHTRVKFNLFIEICPKCSYYAHNSQLGYSF